MEYKHPYFTQEEVEEDKNDILELRKKGIPYRRIIKELGRSMSYVKKIESILLEEGKITEDEIKLAVEQYFSENPVAQGINKTKIGKRSDTTKADIRHQKSIEKKEEICELIKEGYTQAEISRKIEMIEAVVHNIVKELIAEGRIKKSEVNKSTIGSDEAIDRTTKEYLGTRNAIVELLKKGEKNTTIRKKLNLTPYNTDMYIKDIKRYKIMSSEQITKARELKKLKDLQFMAEYIKRGYTLTQIRELKPEFSYNEPTALAKILIELGIITQEEITENRKKGTKNSMNRDCELSAEEQRNLVIKGVQKGLTPLEILNSDKTGSLTMHKVLYQKRLIIEEGIISKEKAEKLMKKHINKGIAKKHKNSIDEIRGYIEKGYYYYEIADMIGVNQAYIVTVKKEYAEKYGWYSREELKKFQQERIIREKAEQEKNIKYELESKAQEQIKRERQKEIEEKENEIREKKLKKIINKVNSERKLAKKEDEQEIDGSAVVSTVGRENYLEVLVEADTLGYELTKQDIDLVFNTITLYPEMSNTKRLKILIMNTMKLNGIRETEKMINALIQDLAKTPYIDSLKMYKSWIKGIEMRPIIKKFKEQGFNNEQIAEKMRISTYEIKQIVEDTVIDFER